jgi:probable rRNA maturation factor
MSALVDARVAGGDWNACGDTETLAEAAARAALAEAGLDPSRYEIGLLFTDDREIARLNANFRGKPAATNVLSWPAFNLSPGETPPAAPHGPASLGDIALAAETVAKESQAQDLAVADHTAHLIIHGVLHLLGYDHEVDAEAEAMERIERAALARLGIADPYC